MNWVLKFQIFTVENEPSPMRDSKIKSFGDFRYAFKFAAPLFDVWFEDAEALDVCGEATRFVIFSLIPWLSCWLST